MAEVREQRRTAPPREGAGAGERQERAYEAPLAVHAAPITRISWGAVIAGAVVAFVALLLFSVLGVAIGFALIEPLTGQVTLEGVGVALGLWWVITGLIAFFIGGWVAGRLSGMPLRADATLHGIIAWGVVTLVSFYLVATGAGIIIGGEFTAVANAVAMGAWWALIAMVVGAVGAAIGAGLGAPQDLPTSTGIRRE